MLFAVDPGVPEPLFEQLAASIRRAVIAGELRPGERLPAARDLAESLAINLHTVLRAYQVLRDEGFIDLRRGRGAVVTSRVADYTELGARVTGLVAEAKRLGLSESAVSALIKKEFSS